MHRETNGIRYMMRDKGWWFKRYALDLIEYISQW